ncbi:hypothetical protein ACMFMG_006052 [Clarireedia jacksonii]
MARDGESAHHNERRAARKARSEAGDSTPQTLSASALAALNEQNLREKRRQEREKARDSGRSPHKEERKGRRSTFAEEAEAPNKDRRRRESAHADRQPERRKRGGLTDDERELSPRKAAYTDDERSSPRKPAYRTNDEAESPRKATRKKNRPYIDDEWDSSRTYTEDEMDSPDRDRRQRKKNAYLEIEPDSPRKSSRTRGGVFGEETAIDPPLNYKKRRPEKRIVSGALLEEGDARNLKQRRAPSGTTPQEGYTLKHPKGLRGGYAPTESSYEDNKYIESDEDFRKRRKRTWTVIGVALVILIIIIAIAVSASKKHKSSSSSATSPTSSGAPPNSNLDGMSEDDIPIAARGTYLDPFTWYDTSDFNVTYTNETVGDLPVMGLNTSYSDDVAPNANAPKISAKWGAFTSRPARGVNLGGWLSIEPFITPSLFNSYSSADGIIDEWTLTSKLGATAAASTLEKHYATFVTEQTFADIAAAGLDHVRIPYSYWAVITYDDDPYVFRTSWRYLLRGIEWARKHGLRINLDLHGLPGSQNGWNHSGRQGVIGWLNGTNGNLNAQRSIEIHDRLSKFFAQDRYKNIISFYGLANEPRMTALNVTAVLDWTSTVTDLVTKNGINAYIVIGDGFRGLENWQGDLTSYSNLVLDVHQYVIFNSGQIVYNHTEKVTYACSGWTQQTEISMDKSTGFGPTMVAEWSQADTDCATYLTNVNQGNRWEGTYNTGDSSTAQTTPDCPTQNSQCSCANANAEPSTYSDTYKEFLQMFAEAQMHSFELSWGWFYWTWKTETSKGGGAQWSYERGLAAGILPKLAYKPDFNCSATIPSFSGLPEYY